MTNGDVIENLYIIASSIKLSRVIKNAITRTHRERILVRAIKYIKYDFNAIFIDCPPNLNLAVVNAILMSDKL